MNKINILAKLIILASLLLFSNLLWSQSSKPEDIGLKYLHDNVEKLGISKADIVELEISNQYRSKHNGVTHIYFIQKYNDIEIDRALINLAITEEDEVHHVGHRFIKDIHQKISGTVPTITANEAVQLAAEKLNINADHDLKLISQKKDQYFEFEKGDHNFRNTIVKLQYKLDTNNQLRLSWQVTITPKKPMASWILNIDAITKEVFYKKDKSLRCSFSKDIYHKHSKSCHSNSLQEINTSSENIMMGETYNVFALPLESPNHGNRSLVVDPADPIASPFGWHDFNGVIGAESTTTQGNNTLTFRDRDDSFTLSELPDGGNDLLFDFPLDLNDEPSEYGDAATVNLFYTTNVVHDIAFRYGFDEAAGNFQETNYTGEGEGGDVVVARSQVGANTQINTNFNNATFFPATEGNQGFLSIHEWTRAAVSGSLLTVTAPSSIIGNYATGSASFGNPITETALIGEVILIDDGIENPSITDACEDIQNSAEITGKIAMIDRGECDFSDKVFKAQESGAIAVIICNNREGGVITMASGANGNNVDIPSIFITQEVCSRLRVHAGSGLEVSLQAPTLTGPDRLDGDFDNGIIAHEYMHGISERLNCGPSVDGSLTSGEGMGEGWSDFLTLALTVQEGDVAEQRRGVGSYVIRQNTDGQGIRTFPYTTDMTINPFTYRNLAVDLETHFVGSVWTTMLWDLYWALVEEHGWSPDLYNGTQGNNIALQLIFDGLKIMPCDPGFVEGRDAILEADQITNGGANQCLIWKVFARRGLGFGADQGTVFSNIDGVPSFEENPFCIKEIKVTKIGPDFIDAGDDITYEIVVINHKDNAVTNLNIVDEIPTNATYAPGSATNGGTLAGNNIAWTIDQLDANDSITVSYTINTSSSFKSAQTFLDDVPTEIADDYWIQEVIENNNSFSIIDTTAHSGDFAWFVENESTLSRQNLKSIVPLDVPANNPVFRFFHKYRTETGIDGGTVELSTDGKNWVNVEPLILKGRYDGQILTTVIGFDRPGAFSGRINDFIPTVIDMSDYANQSIYFRFRFGTSFENSAFGNYRGWLIDDFEFFEMANYDTEVVVTTDQQDEVSASIEGRGTIVESEIVTAVDDPILQTVNVNIYPNPAKNLINVTINSIQNEDIDLQLVTTDGRVLIQNKKSIRSGTQTFPINISHLPTGVYFVKIGTNEDRVIRKIIVQ